MSLEFPRREITEETSRRNRAVVATGILGITIPLEMTTMEAAGTAEMTLGLIKEETMLAGNHYSPKDYCM